jgi:hypothetical protein
VLSNSVESNPSNSHIGSARGIKITNITNPTQLDPRIPIMRLTPSVRLSLVLSQSSCTERFVYLKDETIAVPQPESNTLNTDRETPQAK